MSLWDWLGWGGGVEEKILAEIQALQQEVARMSDAFAELVAAVQAEKTVIDGAIALIQGLAEKLAALAEAPSAEAILALKSEIEAETQALAAAVQANT